MEAILVYLIVLIVLGALVFLKKNEHKEFCCFNSAC
mgnify:CR=1 FL=1